METPMIYEKIEAVEEVVENTMHRRSGDDRVIVHHDETTSYNASGTYAGGDREGDKSCCVVCPRSKDCDGDDCFSTCHKVCGPQCDVAQAEDVEDCTLNVDCGMMSQSSIKMHGDQDMVEGYEGMNAPTYEEQRPKDEWARTPMTSLEGEEEPTPEVAEEPLTSEAATGAEGELTMDIDYE